MPSLICPKCEEQLSTAYIFKQQCERTDAALREYTTQPLPNTIKEENESLDIVVKPDLGMLDMDMYDNDPYSDAESQHSNYSTTVKKKKKVKGSSKVKHRQCKYCNKVLTTKEGLKLHERRHTGEKLKSCPICNASFAKSNHLVRHMSSHNKPTEQYKHTCEECGMGFTKAFHLVKHKREHKNETDNADNQENLEGSTSNTTVDATGVKTEVEDPEEEAEAAPTELPKLRPKKEADETKLHPCKVCNKLLTTAAGLQIHMRRHTGDKLSTCYVNSVNYL